MAFTYCTNCGEKIDMSVGKCPHCGQKIGEDYSYGREEYARRRIEDIRGDNTDRDSQQGRSGIGGEYYPPKEQGENRQGGFDPRAHGNGGRGDIPPMWQPMWRAPMPQRKRPISIGLVIFSVINIIFSCCTFSTLIFGVIALVYVIGAQNAKSYEEEVAKKKIALVLNIVGAVIGVISAVSFSVLFAEALAEMLKNGNIQ